MSSTDSLAISKRSLRRTALVAGAIVIAAAVVIAITVLVKSLSSTDSLASAINSNEFQAVFLANNQVYFGKLTAPGGDFYYLRHVCYLQSQSSAQGKGAPITRLKKLTTDINSPEDLLIINKIQIRFVENLSPAGKAAQILSQNTCAQ